ncbi:o-succinylbenzoate synthase [Vibrio mytili]|uniref:o-succinylbenzoate synthase n=1 Tax=Vibrio mytili TaxID=50718 RepID=A0A0C3IBC4_9VIBR|nr:o-succinylbenzoate synthase [Vibrio mytili]KIN12300.1 O-succinylbenzoate synthase [Vibrio mytili]
MRKAKIYRYCLPMDSGVILRDNKLTERTGYILELSDGERCGYGEVAPLQGFSLEGTEEAGIQLQSQAERWVADLPVDYANMYPSVAFGLSMAQLELTSGLPKEGHYQTAPLCTGDPDELIPKLHEMDGEKVAKVKVGLYEPIRDGMLVNLFLESIPQLTLRLDANRAWTLEKAQQFAKYVTPSLRQRIAFLEEPCRSPGDSLSFAIDTGIAIAWDETLQDAVRREDFSLEELTGVKAIIIKPTLIGSVEFCIKLIEKAKSLGMKAVISSSLESSIGLTQLARLAQWQLPDQVPGLDTIGLFKAQLQQTWPKCELPVIPLSEQELVWQSA